MSPSPDWYLDQAAAFYARADECRRLARRTRPLAAARPAVESGRGDLAEPGRRGVPRTGLSSASARSWRPSPTSRQRLRTRRRRRRHGTRAAAEAERRRQADAAEAARRAPDRNPWRWTDVDGVLLYDPARVRVLAMTTAAAIQWLDARAQRRAGGRRARSPRSDGSRTRSARRGCRTSRSLLGDTSMLDWESAGPEPAVAGTRRTALPAPGDRCAASDQAEVDDAVDARRARRSR